MRKASGRLAAALVALALSSTAGADVIVNGNFEAGNTGFSASSDYRYQTSGQTGPGAYGVVDNPGTAYANGFASFGDHTTGHGLMLFVDAATVANSPFWSETVTVTPNTQYTFSGWATAADNSSPPVIELVVGSTAVGQAFNVDATNPGQWQNFTDAFNSGASTTLTVSLVDLNTGGFGNDFAVDDLSLSPAAAAVPEPGVLGVALLGVASVAAYRRFRGPTPLPSGAA